jgi:hypothetical protein
VSTQPHTSEKILKSTGNYLIQHPVELIPGFNNTVPIVAVHNKDETLCVLEVMPPQRPDLFQATGEKVKTV